MEQNFIDRFITKRKSLKLSVPQLAKFLNLNSASIYKWEGGTKPSEYEHMQKLERFINGQFDEFVNSFKGDPENHQYDQMIENIYHRKPTNDFHNNFAEQDEQELIGNTIEGILSINKIYANAHLNFSTAHKNFSDAHKMAIENNSELTAMLKQKSLTVNELKQIQLDGDAKLRVLQELLIEVGVGKMWKTKSEGEAKLHRMFSDVAEKV